jgi:hypothetical protein
MVSSIKHTIQPPEVNCPELELNSMDKMGRAEPNLKEIRN